MSKLEQLIEELCPNGVEYIALENLCKTNISPKKIPSNDVKDTGKYPVIDQGANFISGFTDNEQALLGLNKYIIFGDHTEIIKYVDFDFAQGADGIKILTAMNCDCRYLYHAFSCKYTKKGKYTRHWSNAKKTLIPLPPLQVQREVVRILDTFSEYTIELTEELTMRKKQYEYYRDSLLTFGDEVEWKKIKDVFQRIKGTSITASKMKEIATDTGEIRIFAGGKTVINAKEKDIENANITKVPSVLVQSRGIIDVLYYEKPFTFKNEMWAYTTNEKITVKYLYYILKKSIYYFRNSASSMGSLPQISLTVTEDYKIPLPPLEEQKRIVDILDRFDTLCNDISKGLPAEIEARQKQYEYYRDKLLTFKNIND